MDFASCLKCGQRARIQTRLHRELRVPVLPQPPARSPTTLKITVAPALDPERPRKPVASVQAIIPLLLKPYLGCNNGKVAFKVTFSVK